MMTLTMRGEATSDLAEAAKMMMMMRSAFSGGKKPKSRISNKRNNARVCGESPRKLRPATGRMVAADDDPDESGQ